ncbi:transporter substrate-binding domain-containing protein [Methylomonas montana]|uniref:transporter substrate-binding domain-containing protein n=1 Tax=Methylomonas montana TaxID=3058963 RepID=UPI002658F8DD|nr:transporter substrate-binding domain-containing protein [Methylomonas montana]WKJ91477.1 transporter substrate-binding domain-containing protein [Methylomonas montana]
MNTNQLFKRLTVMLLVIAIYPVTALATGPRIKQDLFTPNTNAIYALDLPPFITTELTGGGAAIELVNTVLQAQKINATINTLPLVRMLKYYVLQEKALALIGSHIGFSADEQKNLIFVPLLRLKQHYYVYQPKHPDGLPWKGDLKTLANLTYGADPEENIGTYQKAGLKVETGKLLSLLEKLKSGQLDLLANSALAVDWFLDRNFAADKAKFSKLEPAAGEETLFMVFNKNHPEGAALAKQFQDGLTAIIANGQYKALLEKQFGGGEAVNRHILPLQ